MSLVSTTLSFVSWKYRKNENALGLRIEKETERFNSILCMNVCMCVCGSVLIVSNSVGI